LSGADHHRDAVFDQIADLLGGWSFDWEAGVRAWRAASNSPQSSEAGELAHDFLLRSHAVQAAMQAEQDGAAAPLVVAALLHDIGHALAPPPPAGREAGYDDMHEVIAAHWLRNIFVPQVSEPILRHVAAKRYLVATEGGYWDRLEQDSVESLTTQGGPMTPEEVDAYRRLPFWEEGVRLRIWDDNAKSWRTPIQPLEHYLPQLEASLATGPAPAR